MLGAMLGVSLDPAPKIDLHRHLEGSLRLATLAEIARVHRLDLPHTVEGLRPLVQMVAADARTSQVFLSKFNVLRGFYRTPGIIRRLAYEAVEDAAHDHVRYLELRFTPAALARAQGFALRDVCAWVLAGVDDARRVYPATQVVLIASVNRHEPVEVAERVAGIAVECKHEIVALDLAGDEAGFPAEPFVSLFETVRQAGLAVTAHAGEWTGGDSVRHAIERLGVHRIGHGVRVLESQGAVAIARERRIPFEVCLTSNVDSGVATQIETHPLGAMWAAGLRVTVNSDDPGVSAITLGDEHAAALRVPGIDLAALTTMTEYAVEAAFCSELARQALAMQPV